MKTKQLAGTFTYDKCTGKLRLNHVDGSPVKSIRINLAGDDDSYVDTPCRRVVLFASQDGVFNLATAQRAPIDWQCHPGKRLAQLLAVFAPVSWLIEWIFSRCQRPQNQSAQNGNKHANYNHPKGATFVPEFRLHWGMRRHHALRGWAIVSVLGLAMWFTYHSIAVIG